MAETKADGGSHEVEVRVDYGSFEIKIPNTSPPIGYKEGAAMAEKREAGVADMMKLYGGGPPEVTTASGTTVDTETGEVVDVWEGAETIALIGQYVEFKRAMAMLQEDLGHIEMELVRRMDAEGATQYPHPNYEVKLTRAKTYDYGKLAALRELLPPEEISKAWTPAHQKLVDVPESWDFRVARTWGRYGKDVQDVIERATIPGAPRLSIKANTPSQ